MNGQIKSNYIQIKTTCPVCKRGVFEVLTKQVTNTNGKLPNTPSVRAEMSILQALARKESSCTKFKFLHSHYRLAPNVNDILVEVVRLIYRTISSDKVITWSYERFTE